MCARSYGALGILVLALCLAAIPHARATQIQSRDLSQLASDAGLVVEGRVVAQRSYWNAEHTRILTDVEIEVERSHKGRTPARLTVVQMGGVVDGVRMTVHGALQWRADEEVLLFLEPSLPGRHRVAGFTQGRFEIVTDEVTGERFAVRNGLDGVEIVGAAHGGAESSLRLPLRRVLERAGLAIAEER